MKKVMAEWRRFLLEGRVLYDGILHIKPDYAVISEAEALQMMLPEEAVRLAPEDIHVTLLHQSISKLFRKQLENLDMPPPPPIQLEDKVFERYAPGKKSWAVKLVNQEEMRNYVSHILELVGSNNLNPEPERRFHVSLANLTGSPWDSVP